jgi:hypothetical protein
MSEPTSTTEAVQEPELPPDTNPSDTGKKEQKKDGSTAVITVFSLIIAAGLGIASQIADPARTFVVLSVVAGALVVGGFLALVVIIPGVRRNPEIKTEFLSARAAYFCVLVGLVLFAIIAIGAVLTRVMLNLRRN